MLITELNYYEYNYNSKTETGNALIEYYKIKNEINGQSNIDTSLRTPEKHYCQVNVPLQQSGQLKSCVSFNIQIKPT